jgi:streptogramin lyase
MIASISYDAPRLMVGKAGVSSRTGAAGRRRRFRVLTLVATGAALIAAPSALAAPQVNGTFPVPGVTTNNQITQGPDGNMWVTIDNDGANNDVARINSQTGQVTKFNLDDVDSPAGITRLGPNLWVTATNEVARFAPGSTDATDFAINLIGSKRNITVGPDGNLWTVSDNGAIEIPPGDPTSAANHTVLTQGRQIVAGTNNTLWATGGTQVAHFTTAGAQSAGSPYELGGGPQAIAAGPGGQVAFGNPVNSPQQIGRITPPGAPQLTNLGSLDAGFGIAFGNDGAYWITQANGNNLRRFTPQGQSTFLGGFPAAPTRGPRQIAKGPNNTLWVTLIPNDAMQSDAAVTRVSGVTPPPPPPPPPNGCTDNAFDFGKPKRNKKKGTAKLPVEVPCAGTVELAKTKKVKADEETAEAEGEEKLAIKAKGKAKRKLNKKGKAKVKAEVTYTPDGGEPNTQEKKVKLVKRG